MADADHKNATDLLVATLEAMGNQGGTANVGDVMAIYAALVRVIDAQMATVTALATRKPQDLVIAAEEVGKATDAVRAGIDRLPQGGSK
ncbi:MAG: hypothetical protein PS018_26525 [bacterium]|nr:hypothetical protein [bacterium]